jgi:hypothetical protein
MAIFAIIAQPSSGPDNLESAIARAYKDNFLQLGAGNWLVADSVTSKEVSDKLGVTDGKNGSAVVIEVASYYGRASTNIWSWVKNKWEAQNG